MRKITTRLVSAALAASMALSVCPVSVFAAAGAEPESAVAYSEESAKPVTITPEDIPEDGTGYVIGSDHAAEYILQGGTYTNSGFGICIRGVPAEDTIKIHLNGNIITNAGTFILVDAPCALILDGEGSIIQNNDNGDCIYISISYGSDSNATIINGGTYTAKGENSIAIVSSNVGSLTLNKCMISDSNCGVFVKSGTDVLIGDVTFESNTEDVYLDQNATFELTDAYQSTHKIKVGLEQGEYDSWTNPGKRRKITTDSTEDMLDYVVSAKEGYEVRYSDGTDSGDSGDSGETGGGGESGGGGAGEFSLDGDSPVAFDENGGETTAAKGYLYLVKHTHAWNYTAEGAVITAKCTDNDCCYASGVTLTLKAPEVQTEGDGSSCAASVAKDDFDVTGAAVGEIRYKGTGTTTYEESAAAPTAAGTYEASVTVNNVTATVAYTIAPKTYTVTMVDEDGTHTVSAAAKASDKVSVPAAAAKTGYHFAYWEVTGLAGITRLEDAEPTITMGADNVTLTAHYEKNKHTLTVRNASGTTTRQVEYGADVELTPDETFGKSCFEKWTVAGTAEYTVEKGKGETLRFKMPDNDVTVEAHYTQPGGDVQVKDLHYVTAVNAKADKTEAETGETVTVTADEKPGWRFTGFTVTGTKDYAEDIANGKLSFTMPGSDVTVEAHYEKAGYEPTKPISNKHILTVENGEQEAETRLVEMGKTVTLTADDVEGKVFTGWTVDGLTNFNETPAQVLTFTMPGNDVNAVAHYRADEPDEPVITEGSVGTVAGVLGATAIAGVVGVNAYALATEAYIRTAMAGIILPANREEMALLIWEKADKPEPASTELFEDIDADDTDAQKAARWMVEQELMTVDEDEPAEFHPLKAVSRLRICLTWHEAKEKGLIK